MAQVKATQTDLGGTLATCGLSGTPWYAVLDAARDDSMPARAADAGLQVQSLYAGDLGDRLADVAPHLATFELDNDFARWLLSRWGGQQGILLQTEASFAELRRHLRRFLLVKDEDGKRYRFRFYDPRVLRSFLPACSADELQDFFGPVACFYASGRQGDLVLSYRNGPKELITREYPVDRPEAPTDDAGPAVRAPGKGALTVRLTDAATGAPIAKASVQAEGPTAVSAVTGAWGDVRFAGLKVGEYEVFAIDRDHRMARATTRVTPEGVRLHLRCRVESSTSDTQEA